MTAIEHLRNISKYQPEHGPFRNQIVLELFDDQKKEMLMLATVLTLALLAAVLATIVRMVRHDGRKIIAALKGQSWIAAPPTPLRPVTVRFSQRYPATRALRVPPAWRAAA